MALHGSRLRVQMMKSVFTNVAGKPANQLVPSMICRSVSLRCDERFCRKSRLRPLAACLALAFCASSAGARSELPAQSPMSSGGHPGAHLARVASSVSSAVTFHVTTCDDPLPVPSTCVATIDGSVREGFLCAHNGDTIDLTQLTCSKITLSAPLVAGPGSLTLVGPGQDKLTIDAGGTSRAIVHNAGAYDGLYVNDLTIVNGHYDNPQPVPRGGGCIFSSGNVFVSYSTISNCYTSAVVADAIGGAIEANGTASLYRSTVTGNTAHANGDHDAHGGGIVAYTAELNRSTVSGNTASYAGAGRASAGGISAFLVRADYSTISGNGAATSSAGIYAGYAYLFSSTVSANHADHGPVGGVYARFLAQIFSSTIAGNTSKGAFAAGLYGGFGTAPKTIVQSTIIAGNKASGVEVDVGTTPGFAIIGSNNLIVAPQGGTTVPFDTNFDDPLLGPLQDNGGPTRTLALLPGSPAINRGKTGSGVTSDQRGFARVVGGKPDIGAFEFDPDVIFVTGFN